MKKKALAITVGILVIFSFGGCKKKTEEQKTQSPHGMESPGIMMPKGESKIVVPDSVKGKWKGVVISIEDKAKKTKQDVTILLGGEYSVPNTNLKIQIGEFLPDFKMEGATITSSSAQPNNPAVHVKVFEGDKEIFNKWLYEKFPEIHPFQHEKIGLTLKEGVKS
jgi:hypothetical protein